MNEENSNEDIKDETLDDELKQEPENVTREINLDELYDGVINNTVVIDPVTNDELLLKQKKSNFKFVGVILAALILLILYYVNNKMGIGLTAKDKETTTKKVVTTTAIKNKKGTLNCTYTSKSDTDSQNVAYSAVYENDTIIESTFDYAAVTNGEKTSDIINNLSNTYEEFYIANASVTGNIITFEKIDKGFTFNIKTDYKVSKFDEIKMDENKLLLYVKPESNDNIDSLKESYTNKGFTCNLIEDE